LGGVVAADSWSEMRWDHDDDDGDDALWSREGAMFDMRRESGSRLPLILHI